jgi:non-ribosomal peptide synthetase component F
VGSVAQKCKSDAETKKPREGFLGFQSRRPLIPGIASSTGQGDEPACRLRRRLAQPGRSPADAGGVCVCRVGQQLTYAELAAAVAQQLLATGMTAGDRVALHAPTSLETIACALGVMYGIATEKLILKHG